jgi:hypothetical protein
VASTVSELVVSKIAACHAIALLMSHVTNARGIDSRLYSTSSSSFRVEANTPPRDVDGKNAVPAGSVTSLLKEARHVVTAARSASY